MGFNCQAQIADILHFQRRSTYAVELKQNHVYYVSDKFLQRHSFRTREYLETKSIKPQDIDISNILLFTCLCNQTSHTP